MSLLLDSRLLRGLTCLAAKTPLGNPQDSDLPCPKPLSQFSPKNCSAFCLLPSVNKMTPASPTCSPRTWGSRVFSSPSTSTSQRFCLQQNHSLPSCFQLQPTTSPRSRFSCLSHVDSCRCPLPGLSVAILLSLHLLLHTAAGVAHFR